MFLIVGLGNPEAIYRETRHNFGYMVVEDLASRLKQRFRKGRGPYDIAECKIGSEEVALVKPLTYMNRSGIALDDLFKRYSIDLSQLLVLCDDLNLPLGKMRIRGRGSDGGHNGLASIITYLRTDAFPRLRLGIGTDEKMDAVDFVLSSFHPGERHDVEITIRQAIHAVRDFVENGLEWAMNRYNH